MHNGHIEGFASFKRAMVNLLTQEAYLNVTGVTDTEHAFALLLSQLRDPGRSSSFSREELEDALDEMIRIVAKLQAAAGVTGGFTTLNLALSDGETLVATRYCDKWPETPPPSLYFCYDRSETLRAALHQQTGGSGGPGDGSKNAGGGDKEAAALLDDQAMRPSGVCVCVWRQCLCDVPHHRCRRRACTRWRIGGGRRTTLTWRRGPVATSWDAPLSSRMQLPRRRRRAVSRRCGLSW